MPNMVFCIIEIMDGGYAKTLPLSLLLLRGITQGHQMDHLAHYYMTMLIFSKMQSLSY